MQQNITDTRQKTLLNEYVAHLISLVYASAFLAINLSPPSILDFDYV
jgi:hypothetical protein